MKIPERLKPLVEDGLVDDVIRQLMSGKEATVYVVRCGDDVRCAKVYKEANQRSFRQSVDYTEGRKTKSSRQARAMEKGSKYGRKLQEQAWQSHEVDALYRLAAAGVRVPKPHNFYEGVLLMELVVDEEGNAAPRLNDVAFTPEDARKYHDVLLREVVRMLCAGIIHGDLSEFNILLASDGLTDLVRDDDIRDIMRAAPTAEAACYRLVEAAKLRGGHDNITTVIIRMHEADWLPPRGLPPPPPPPDFPPPLPTP